MVLGITRRGQPRAKVRWPVRITTASGSVNGETHNISTSGAFILCQEPPSLEGDLQMVIKVPHRQALKIMAKVIWKTAAAVNDRPPIAGLGVQFSRISADDRQLLRSLIIKHSHKK